MNNLNNQSEAEVNILSSTTLEVDVNEIDSIALARVLEDLSNSKAAYDRLHNKHNR